jgi:signal transduction histidine kinase
MQLDPKINPVSLSLIEPAEIKKQFQYLSQYPLLSQFIDAIPTPVMILNKQRQLVFSNKALLKLTGQAKMDIVFGMRPGEIFSCYHAYDNSHSCGSTEFCVTCGALKSILMAADPSQNIQECRIITTANEALDLRIFSSPIKINNDEFTLFTVTDISDEKRRKNLERIFFHDLLNTASTVKALTYNLGTASKEDSAEFRSHLLKLSDKLVEEICAQRDIYAAENNELAVYLSRYNSFVLLNDIYEQFSFYQEEKKIVIDQSSETFDFFTDKVLMRRIMSNMLKNALEASSANSIIRMGSRKNSDNYEFWVHNQGYIEKDIQLQMFQRSFSTKGQGRGIGTYSMKLLCENFLKGKIRFRSTEEEGTTFYCSVPVNYD